MTDKEYSLYRKAYPKHGKEKLEELKCNYEELARFILSWAKEERENNDQDA